MDVKNQKSNAQEKAATELRYLKREITTSAETKFFTLNDLRMARYRFQPHRLHSAPSLRKGTMD